MRRRQSFVTVLIGKSVLIREGIAGILSAANFRTLASVSCADDLPLGKFQSQHVLVLIVHTGDDIDSVVEQIEFLRERHPKARIAIVADHYRLDEMVATFRAGANGYFIDVMTGDVFVKSLELVMMGEPIFPPAFMSYVLDSENDHLRKDVTGDAGALVLKTEEPTVPLSPREKSIMHCLIEGDSNKSIARKIDIAEATVKVHVKAILRKIRVQNRTQAAIWAMNNGSLSRPATDVSRSAAVDEGKLLPGPMEVVSSNKQIETSVPLGTSSHRLIRKSVKPKEPMERYDSSNRRGWMLRGSSRR
ncbi:MAG: response regulator transcription factor [Pseudolabrys sp.]|jgi:two-component system nitrate/nitrite response regulator NarL